MQVHSCSANALCCAAMRPVRGSRHWARACPCMHLHDGTARSGSHPLLLLHQGRRVDGQSSKSSPAGPRLLGQQRPVVLVTPPVTKGGRGIRFAHTTPRHPVLSCRQRCKKTASRPRKGCRGATTRTQRPGLGKWQSCLAAWPPWEGGGEDGAAPCALCAPQY